MVEESKSNIAACAICLNAYGKILAIKLHNSNDYSIPCGYVRLDELPNDAIIDIVLNKTGYRSTYNLYTIKKSCNNLTVYCYVQTNLSMLEYELDTHEHITKWVSVNEVCKGQFGDFIKQLLTEVGLL